MGNPVIPFHVPWVTAEERRAVSSALKSRWLTGGSRVVDFETSFAHYVGAKYAIATNSCTAALHLAMRVLKVGASDEVIVPDFTFAATANAPIFCGAKPVFADIDEKTFNISPVDLQSKINSRTKAIIPVHYGGQPCDMKEILEIAEDNKLSVVEDCAHSLGAEYQGVKTGNLGVMGCFSFYPTKIITTMEGGMVTTNDGELAKKLRLLREHGMSKTAIDRESTTTWHYDVVDLGYNYRLTEPQAVMGLVQMKKIEKGIKRRTAISDYYTSKFSKRSKKGIIPPYIVKDRTHVFHLYTIRVKKEETGITRNDLFKKLSKAGIQSSVLYTPLHLMSYYKQFLNKDQTAFPVAEKVYDEILSLPIYPTMTKKERSAVATGVLTSLLS
ncbi:DegT/DnrJ/EryC1/StrS family aminotransferase [Candidatus Bathyarchaeota archaeon]|nr:DegT/DnrJ/EryC1/StrS family aminotransferase [Candidatus Bathyarchaeota archaeon]